MPKTKKPRVKKPGQVDPVTIQVGIGGKWPRGVRRTKALMDQIINEWARTGHVPKGLKITAVRWKNPRRRNAGLAVWKEALTPGSIIHARATLRMRQLLRGGMRFSSVGRG